MRIEVDMVLCRGHAMCVEDAPEVFGTNEDGFVVVLQPKPAEALWESVREAAKYCPNRTITLHES